MSNSFRSESFKEIVYGTTTSEVNLESLMILFESFFPGKEVRKLDEKIAKVLV